MLISADAGVREKAARVNATACLQKPFTVEQLIGAIQAGLSAA